MTREQASAVGAIRRLRMQIDMLPKDQVAAVLSHGQTRLLILTLAREASHAD